jgi:hypothetical protein
MNKWNPGFNPSQSKPLPKWTPPKRKFYDPKVIRKCKVCGERVYAHWQICVCGEKIEKEEE